MLFQVIGYSTCLRFDSNVIDLNDVAEICFNTYEEVLEVGIKKCLTLEKNENR